MMKMFVLLKEFCEGFTERYKVEEMFEKEREI